MSSRLPVKPVRSILSFFPGYITTLHHEHYPAIPTTCVAATTALSAGASGVNGQGEPVVAFAMVFLSCVFAVLASVSWKGISKRSTLSRVIRVVLTGGFLVWSGFSAILIWRNRPKDKWTTFTWEDVAIARSYVVSLLVTGWKPIVIVFAILCAFLLGRRIGRPIQTTGNVKKPFSPEWFLSIAEEDKKELQKAVKIYAVNCETHFTDPVPHVDFTFGVFSMALVAVYVDDAIEPPIIFWPSGYNGEQHKMRREPTMEVNHSKPCYFRWPSKFTIRQDVTPEEVAMISNASDTGFFRLAALKIPLRGEGFSGIRLGTDLTVKSNGRFWLESPEYIFGGDPERDAILKALYSLWEEGKILLGKAEDGTIEYLDRQVNEWQTKTADY